MASYPVSSPTRDARAQLGRYELLGLLATGGMAEIHLARLAGEAGFQKVLVVKRLLPELVASPAYVQMFLDEGKLVSRLDHPNICEVYELGKDGADYFLAMPFLDGIAVQELIARPREADRRTELRVAAAIVAQACAGLHHAHELKTPSGAPSGLVHRDVSPSNLFVTSAGSVKVLDFGIAKVQGGAATELGTVKGKSQYMAPEQLLGEPVDRRCDVFALGIVLFELATHQRLFKRPSDYLVARALLEEPIPRADAVDPAVPAPLADVIERALARDREARFATAAEMARAIDTAMARFGGLATSSDIAAAVRASDELTAMRTRQLRVLDEARGRTTGLATVPRHRRRKRRAPLVIALAVVAVAASITAFVWTREGSSPARSPVVIDAGVVALAAVADAAVEPPLDAAVAAALDAAVDAGIEIDAAPARPHKPAVRVPKRGLVSIESTPYATIYLGATSLGPTPIVKRTLPAGRHELRAVLKDGRSRRFVVDVPPGKLAPPIHLRW